jgi:error-prone DNA polymerase
MQPAGPESILNRWREAGEWWAFAPQREITRSLDAKGVWRETIREVETLAPTEVIGQTDYVENHREDYALRVRKIRDEKCAAACGKLPRQYYEEQARERRVETRPDRRVMPSSAPVLTTGYVAVHALSGYAFGRSSILAEELAAHAAAKGASAVAIADPFSLVGAVEHVRSCRRHGVKPLVAASIELPEGGEIVLIAPSKRGYRNLSQLITACHLGQPRGFPLTTWNLLHQYSGDLICLTGGDLGPINRRLMSRRTTAAADILDRLVACFGGHSVYVEMERSWLPWEASVNAQLADLAESRGLPCVAGGVITHGERTDFPGQDILVCAHSLAMVDEVTGRKPLRHEDQPPTPPLPRRSLNAERFFPHARDVLTRFADHPEWIANGFRLAERCDDDVLPGRTRLPALYPDDSAALRELVDVRARETYGSLSAPLRHRLEYEVDRICRLGFATHFLVASDFCEFARREEIQLSGRGSVVDSVVAYVLGMSRIDAMKHRLHFDRFLPEDGAKRPDIDIDFEAHRRDDIRNYLIQKYGVERVGQVCAIGAYCTRGIIREVGKAMGLPPEAITFLAKRIHGGVPPDQMIQALQKKPELRGSNIPVSRYRWIFRLAKQLMDVPRDIRCHSSGVVISDAPLAETVPVMWSASMCHPDDEAPSETEALRLIQWDKRSAKYYFDKFDILCLRGQDVLSGTEKRVRQVDATFRATSVPNDDPETYRAFRSGELIGIPQSASPAMRQAHIRLQTENLDDASLVQAGIRPGVGGAVKINELIARRRGKPYEFLHEDFQKILGNTYGIIVFQEQVDQLLQTFGGYSSGEAEDIRDAIHKRRREDFGQRIRDELIRRVLDRGYGMQAAEQVFDYVAGFKGYGFAQGHALAFAEISIRSVYCQQNYPAEYFSALLSAQPAGYYGPCTIANEARTRGVAVLHPDVNRGRTEFTVESIQSAMNPKVILPNAAIRVGLSQIQGLSQDTQARIVASPVRGVIDPRGGEIRFRSLFHFAEVIRPNRDELEKMILCGAFDSLHPNRRAMLWAIPDAMALAHRAPSAQAELPFDTPDPRLPNEVEDFSGEEKSVFEREILGLDVHHHLMAYERERVASRGGITTATARQLEAGRTAVVVGNPIRLRFPPTASGKRVVFFDLEDETGLLNVTCFDNTYQRDGHAIVCSPYVTILGEAQNRDGHIAFLAERVFPYRPTLLQGQRRTLPIPVADFLVG